MKLDDGSYAATVLTLLAQRVDEAPSGSWPNLAAALAQNFHDIALGRHLLQWGRDARGVVELGEACWERLERAHQLRTGGRKAHGVFYTPQTLVEQVTDAAFSALGTADVRVLDPACGAGAFLREAATRDGAVVYGIDRDEHAVALARAALAGSTSHVAAGDFLSAQPPRELFDVVIGNPPYVRYHAMNLETIGWLRGRFATATAQFDLFGPMIEHSLSMVRDGGVLAFVLPSLFLRGPRYAALRRYVLQQGSVVLVTEHGDGMFEGVLAPTCHIVVKKGERAPGWYGSEKIDSAAWLDDPDCVWGVSELRGRELGTMARIRRGYPAGRKHAAWGSAAVDCVAGTDLEAFRLKQIRKFDPDVGGWPETLGRADGERVLVRETGARLIACVAPPGVHITRTVYAVWPTETDCYTLCALLNSESAQQWYRNWCRPDTGIFPKLRMSQLRRFPIPEMTADQADELATLARQVEGGAEVTGQIDELVGRLYRIK